MDKTSTTTIGITARTVDRSRAIGSILVDDGRLSTDDVDSIQRFANEHGLQFGDAAVQLKLLEQEDADFALARQFRYPIVTHGEHGGVADDVIAAYRPQSEEVEALRTLRSQLMLRWFNHATRKVL